MKSLKNNILFLLTIVFSITILTSCVSRSKTVGTTVDTTNIGTPDPESATDCTPLPIQSSVTSPTHSLAPSSSEIIEDAIKDIENRVDWIVKELGGYPFRGDTYLISELGTFTYRDNGAYKDFYDGDTLVYRIGNIEYYDKIEGGIGYYLFYNEEGRLIYADIVQYRHPAYCIYFYNDKHSLVDQFIRLIVGERTNEKEVLLDELMINAIMLCFENAYK